MQNFGWQLQKFNEHINYFPIFHVQPSWHSKLMSCHGSATSGFALFCLIATLWFIIQLLICRGGSPTMPHHIYSLCLLLPDGHQAIGSSAVLPFPPTSPADDKFSHKHICLLVLSAIFFRAVCHFFSKSAGSVSQRNRGSQRVTAGQELFQGELYS